MNIEFCLNISAKLIKLKMLLYIKSILYFLLILINLLEKIFYNIWKMLLDIYIYVNLHFRWKYIQIVSLKITTAKNSLGDYWQKLHPYLHL